MRMRRIVKKKERKKERKREAILYRDFKTRRALDSICGPCSLNSHNTEFTLYPNLIISKLSDNQITF